MKVVSYDSWKVYNLLKTEGAARFSSASSFYFRIEYKIIIIIKIDLIDILWLFVELSLDKSESISLKWLFARKEKRKIVSLNKFPLLEILKG